MGIPPEGIETPGGFLLHRDEFGDLASTFIYDTDQEFVREQEADALAGLMDQLGLSSPPKFRKLNASPSRGWKAITSGRHPLSLATRLSRALLHYA